MIAFEEHQNLHGYPYGFIYAKAVRGLGLTFPEYVSILQWVVDRFGPMDAPGSRFEKDFVRQWTASKEVGFAFMNEDAAMEFKLRWY